MSSDSPFPHICGPESELRQPLHVELLSRLQHWVALRHKIFPVFLGFLPRGKAFPI